MKNKLTDVSTVEAGGEWFVAGRSSEDNTVIEGARYFVIAETSDGFRFRHDHNFCSGKMEQSPDDGFNQWFQNHEDDEAKAEYLATRITVHLMDGGKLNEDHWVPVQGRYGSRGWDEQAECDLEREEEASYWGGR